MGHSDHCTCRYMNVDLVGVGGLETGTGVTGVDKQVKCSNKMRRLPTNQAKCIIK